MLDLRLRGQVALQQYLLQPKGGAPVRPWHRLIWRLGCFAYCLQVLGTTFPSIGPSAYRHDAVLAEEDPT
jgi:hypothetical protein